VITLSRQQLSRYDRDGILFPIRVFSGDEASRFQRELQSVADHCGDSQRRLDGLHLFFDWAYRLVSHEALLNAVEDLLGSDILVDGSLVFYKPAHDSSYVSWHQDSVYSDWHQTPSTSAWIALTASHRANGCMRAILGSHKLGPITHVTVRDGLNLLIRGEQISMVDETEAVDVELEPGEMSFHESNLIHGSNPNTSDQPRIGFIVRYVTNRVTNRDRPLLRVRGSADCSHLLLATPPVQQNHRSSMSAWRSLNP
jgi:ectoine hydroxylase-related dioxygenase (phytanoyl-CoA dioxygenase family)